MRFLADEGCDFAAVRALRAAGHDVTTVREVAPGATDETVIRLAVADGRIVSASLSHERPLHHR